MTLQVADQQFLILGAGKTGRSLATVLHERGARIRLVERDASALARAALPASVDARVGDAGEDLIQGVDLVVPSPGVPKSHVLLQRAAARGVPIMSEIEVASRLCTCPILAVTGTNGKSTTTVLLGAMLSAAGKRTFIGGNLGTPFIEACVPGAQWEVAVVEVSSFQLEWVQSFRPCVAIVLNLTPDHLDRYATMEEYGHAKAALLAAQQQGDIAVLNRDDPWVWELRRNTRAGVISFGGDRVEFGSCVDGDTIVYWGPEPAPRRFAIGASRLQGAHNRENMMAATTAAAIWGVPDAAIQHALEQTPPLPHRLELVRECRGVRFFDDSKGTNVGAVEKSLRSFSGDVILLVGGYDKGGDFRALRALVRERAKHVVLFGAAARKIQAQLRAGVPESLVSDLSAAVGAAAALAGTGDTVLLSPGCASFDEFTDYAARGRRFREIVEAL